MSSGISDASSYSTSTFSTALVFNAAVFGGELLAFTLLRPYFPAIYQPRTYIPPDDKRASELSRNIILWPWAVLRADYVDIKAVNGLDAYFFVRFLRMMVRILVPIWLISWVVLLPVYSVGTTSGTSDSLTQFEFGNVGRNAQARLWAPLVLTWGFTIWILWNVRYEMDHFIHTRQRWLIDPINSSMAQANTVLVTGVPQRYLTEAAITSLFSYLPGGVAKVWLNRDLKEMPDLYDRQVKACKVLESAETSLMNTAVKRRNKRLKKEAKAAKKAAKKGGAPPPPADPSSDDRRLTDPSIADTERGEAYADTLVPRKKRPTRRLPLLSFLPSLPLVGKQVDSIDWAREEIAVTTEELRKMRRELGREVARASAAAAAPADERKPDALKPDARTAQTYPPLNSAFVLFNQQIAAHLAAQALTHHAPYRMAQKHVGVMPEDVIWGNLNMNPYEAKMRTALSWAATLGLIILWSFPVAFVGAVSNVASLCTTYKWLAWLCKLPSPIIGIISGILSPVLLAVLMALLPVVLRLFARFEGMTTRTAIELSLMNRYFLFLVIHSFLIVTLSSGIIAALPSLVEDTGSIPTTLAEELPKASVFFLSYIILQGLSGTATGFLAYIPLAIYYVKLYLTGSTPRSIYNIKYRLRSVQWGNTFPVVSLLVCITLAYSVISPIINGLAAATFFLYYVLWKYRFLWQLGQPRSSESGGRFFPKAIQHVFVGLYIKEVCLAALFFLARDSSGKASAVPQGALMIVLIVFTAFFHLILDNSYDPLIHVLPLTLAGEDQVLADPNRHAAERELCDNASVTSMDAAQTEKRHDQEMRARTGSQASGDGKARVKTVESAEPDADADMLAPGTAAESRRVSQISVRGIDEEEGPKDFYHPASVEPQQTIWLPRDPLGLCDAEEAAIRERGIRVASEDARMDDKGHVDISGAPPGEREPAL
ncbi:DUF221-domain-containing protein [Daedalea quercina L-15889]|uniref:DUF221-domain-containing protein n=1 Tax=Daedalea quercina L-15889 TaxID=1314783 RepID=A0A165M7B8_9APHY|nr:DUF221-domain-containing protein [Daedalea quercina L-15889]